MICASRLCAPFTNRTVLQRYLCSANTHLCAQELCTTSTNNLCSKTNPCNYEHKFDSGPHLLPIIVQYVTHIYDTHADQAPPCYTKFQHVNDVVLHGSWGRDGNIMLFGRQVDWNSTKGKQIPTNSYRYNKAYSQHIWWGRNYTTLKTLSP